MSAGVGIRRFHRWVSMAFTAGRATLQFPHALAAQCGWMREGGAQPIVIYGQATRQSRRRIARPARRESQPGRALRRCPSLV